MTRQLLIDNIVRQTTLLIAQLATSGGVRSGLVFRLGSGKNAAYRAATADEIASLRDRTDGLAELVWMLVYREGPLTAEALAGRTSLQGEVLASCLAELVVAENTPGVQVSD